MTHEPAVRMDPRLAQRISEKKQALDARRPLSANTLRLIYADIQIRLTFHSNALEGNTLSLRETQLVVEHGITIGGHSLAEHIEATNHATAVQQLIAMAEASSPLGLEDILELHRLVMDRLLDQPGQLRQAAVSIRGATLQPPSASRVPGLLAEWLGWIEHAGLAYTPVSRAAIAHHGFVAIHPFRDGNGRTGRLLLNLLLMRAGYPPALLLQEWRLGYLEALAQADRGRLNPLINLIGRAVEIGLDLYLEASEQVEHEPELLSLRELAEKSPYSAEYLALLIRKGRLEGVKRGHSWYSTRAAVERYQGDVARRTFPSGRPKQAKQ